MYASRTIKFLPPLGFIVLSFTLCLALVGCDDEGSSSKPKAKATTSTASATATATASNPKTTPTPNTKVLPAAATPSNEDSGSQSSKGKKYDGSYSLSFLSPQWNTEGSIRYQPTRISSFQVIHLEGGVASIQRTSATEQASGVVSSKLDGSFSITKGSITDRTANKTSDFSASGMILEESTNPQKVVTGYVSGTYSLTPKDEEPIQGIFTGIRFKDQGELLETPSNPGSSTEIIDRADLGIISPFAQSSNLSKHFGVLLQNQTNSFKVASFNTSLAEDVPFYTKRLIVMASAIKAIDADVVCLQEVWKKKMAIL